MPVSQIQDLEDPRLAPYRDLKQVSRTRWTRWVIAEGWRVTKRLLQSPLRIESVLMSDKRLETLQDMVPDHVPLLVLSQEDCKTLVGFNFHAGVLAAAHRPKRLDFQDWADDCGVIEPVVALPQINDPDNVGLIARTAAALGIRKLILSTHSSDPYSRRCLRLSMGAVLRLSIFESSRIEEHLIRLHSEHGFTICASVCDPNAMDIARWPVPNRSVLVLGNESDGLAECFENLCQQRFTIPISPGIDSLNVSTATGIMLYEWSRQRRHPPHSNGEPCKD
jgi:tRNA G18 (ribose-2'-O)-methylase SpoU